MTIKALVFDFDGLILDTETPEFYAWQEIYQRHGATIQLSEWLLCVGSTYAAFNPYETLKVRANKPVDQDQVKSDLHEISWNETQKKKPLPGVIEYLETARQTGLKIGLASSSKRNWVYGNLERLQLLEYFDSICIAEDVEQVKPDPALYQLSVKRLGVQPHEAIAFEDSINGMRSAQSAGLTCVAIPNEITRFLDFSSADLILNSLADVTLANLLQRLDGHASQTSL